MARAAPRGAPPSARQLVAQFRRQRAFRCAGSRSASSFGPKPDILAAQIARGTRPLSYLHVLDIAGVERLQSSPSPCAAIRTPWIRAARSASVTASKTFASLSPFAARLRAGPPTERASKRMPAQLEETIVSRPTRSIPSTSCQMPAMVRSSASVGFVTRFEAGGPAVERLPAGIPGTSRSSAARRGGSAARTDRLSRNDVSNGGDAQQNARRRSTSSSSLIVTAHRRTRPCPSENDHASEFTPSQRTSDAGRGSGTNASMNIFAAA